MLKKFLQNGQMFCILLLALGLRLPFLNGSFWLDEAAQALESARPFSQQLNITDDFQPPLIHLLIHFLLAVSRNECCLRSGAALGPGIITIWATYQMGQKLWNKNTGLAAAVLLSTSSFHVFYSQELRPYALPAMLATLSWLCLVHMMKKNNLRMLVCYSILTGVGFYSSYLYPFLWISQIFRSEERRVGKECRSRWS